MTSSKHLMKLLKQAQKTNIKTKDNPEKLELLKVKRDKLVSELERPFIIDISNQDGGSRDWLQLIYNNAELFTHDVSTKKSTYNKEEFIKKIVDHSSELKEFKFDLKGKLFQSSLLFYKSVKGKSKGGEQDRKIDDIIKAVVDSITEKVLKIETNTDCFDRFINIETAAQINNCLLEEFNKHSSRNNIIRKIDKILQKRYKEYEYEYEYSNLSVTSQIKAKQNLEFDINLRSERDNSRYSLHEKQLTSKLDPGKKQSKSIPELNIDLGIPSNEVKRRFNKKNRGKKTVSLYEEEQKKFAVITQIPKSILDIGIWE
ncbi:MAG: hypothetical protein AB8U16_00505 [Rickettsiales endosymbiont of Dermacentor nuttalli]